VDAEAGQVQRVPACSVDRLLEDRRQQQGRSQRATGRVFVAVEEEGRVNV